MRPSNKVSASLNLTFHHPLRWSLTIHLDLCACDFCMLLQKWGVSLHLDKATPLEYRSGCSNWWQWVFWWYEESVQRLSPFIGWRWSNESFCFQAQGPLWARVSSSPCLHVSAHLPCAAWVSAVGLLHPSFWQYREGRGPPSEPAAVVASPVIISWRPPPAFSGCSLTTVPLGWHCKVWLVFR